MPSSDHLPTSEERQAATDHNFNNSLVKLPVEILDIIYGFVLAGTTVHITRRTVSSIEGKPDFAGVVCRASQSFEEAYEISKEGETAADRVLDPDLRRRFLRIRGVERPEYAHKDCFAALALAASGVECKCPVGCTACKPSGRPWPACSCRYQHDLEAREAIPERAAGYFCNVMSLMLSCKRLHEKQHLSIFRVTFSFQAPQDMSAFAQNVLGGEERRAIPVVQILHSLKTEGRWLSSNCDWYLPHVKQGLESFPGLKTVQMYAERPLPRSAWSVMGHRWYISQTFDDLLRLPCVQVVVGGDMRIAVQERPLECLGFGAFFRARHRRLAQIIEDHVRKDEHETQKASSFSAEAKHEVDSYSRSSGRGYLLETNLQDEVLRSQKVG